MNSFCSSYTIIIFGHNNYILFITLLPVFFKSIGLTSSLDNILKTTDPATLSECTPIPVGLTKEIDVKPSQPVTDQIPTTRDIITVPESTHSQSDSDSSNISNSTHLHSRLVDKSTSTAPCDSETFSRDLNQSKVQTLSTDITAKDSASVVDSSEPAYKAMSFIIFYLLFLPLPISC